MTNFKKQVFSVVTAGVMIANVATPALATNIEISGNGAGADSNVAVQTTNAKTVSQNNTANVTNTVKTEANTGDNKANYNTGGNVGIQTGVANVTANVNNDLNKNIATVDCCAAAANQDVKISGNGADSNNEVGLTNVNAITVGQNNAANVTNNVDADAETGNNKAGLNTGGDVTIVTGAAKVNVDVNTTANVNSAHVGGGMSATPTPSASFTIVGNGAGSDNKIAAALVNATTVAQNNVADIDNEVDADAETGDNEANFNTGGDVVIASGLAEGSNGAKVTVGIDNSVNFNFADVDCGCEYDVNAKIAGNGADTDKKWWDNEDNYIGVNLANTQAVGQGNAANLDNEVDVDDANTGDNEAGYNTGAVDYASDPAIVTGGAHSTSTVSNSGNVNAVGNMFDMPEMPEVDFSFNFAAMMAFFGMSH